ncbi:MAG: adenylate/guanylate cyclase domain-containing protein, partial [Chloroflexota bacterium]
MTQGKVYIPMDWRHSIASNTTLPSEQTGSTLFADISGFTPLTEAFALELGPKRGGEELTIHLNRVYDQIISVLHGYRGSVIGFSGDSITCWFDQDLDGRSALRCALEMQTQMSKVAEIRTRLGREFTLGLKVTVATGSVKRFTVGMADYTIMDAMAGKTVERMATAEGFASAGDVVIDHATYEALSDHLKVSQWHEDAETGEQYATIESFSMEVPQNPWTKVGDSQLTYDQVDDWLLPAVASRINSGLGDFLTELRPAAALFMRFTGIEFETDDSADDKLREFVQSVQRIIMRLEGSLVQLTIGDKGSYLYAAFGAPIAHENDVERAALAALALQEECGQFEFIKSMQIGISHGLMRTGAYGGSERRTYGVLGDHVNLSARLMSKTPNGQIYVSQRAQRKISKLFEWESLPPMKVKGKAQPIQVHRLVKSKLRRAIRLNEPEYSLPMIGRSEELKTVSDLVEEVLEGKGQIIGITAEAGMGKSRLSAEVIRMCMDEGMSGYGGECQSFGTNTSYLVWQPILQTLFKSSAVQDESSREKFLKELTDEIELINPSLVPRIPLLGSILQIDIPENDLTKSLDAKTRKASLESFIVDVILARSLQQPIILVFEDCHWLDPLSLELIESLGRSIEQAPVFVNLVYRPPDSYRTQLPNVHELSYFTEIQLETFTKEEAERLIAIKVEQYFEESNVPQRFINLLVDKAAGNPFYLDEIINFIKDREIDLRDEKALAGIDLPNTIYSLVLSRIDNLTESQKMAIKVASVIGRLFTAAMVWGIYPTNEITTMVKQDLHTLSELELTPIEQPEPELTYLFKHIVTQEVAYESLPYTTKARLHGQIGDYLEFK